MAWKLELFAVMEGAHVLVRSVKEYKLQIIAFWAPVNQKGTFVRLEYLKETPFITHKSHRNKQPTHKNDQPNKTHEACQIN